MDGWWLWPSFLTRSQPEAPPATPQLNAGSATNAARCEASAATQEGHHDRAADEAGAPPTASESGVAGIGAAVETTHAVTGNDMPPLPASPQLEPAEAPVHMDAPQTPTVATPLTPESTTVRNACACDTVGHGGSSYETGSGSFAHDSGSIAHDSGAVVHDSGTVGRANALRARAVSDMTLLLSEQYQCTSRPQRMMIAEQVMEYLLTEEGHYLIRSNMRFARSVRDKVSDLLGQSPSTDLAFLMGRVWQEYQLGRESNDD